MTTEMKSVLLVKTSSLGDVVHNLPVASDIRRAFPDAAIDWVVEEAFAATPRSHPAVREVLPVAVRRWRSALWRRRVGDEIVDFVKRLREHHYDVVIDTQGLLKSALIARIARGARYGLDRQSSREPLGLFYDETFNVPRSQHAVERNRTLAARALHYTAEQRIDYGIRSPAVDFAWLPRQRYVVLLHATSAQRKLWPEAQWRDLVDHFSRCATCCVLPWGNASERARSERLAQHVSTAIVPPALPLDEVMGLLAGAHAVIGVDTGLVHLAAALGVATIGIYCATDPARTGIYGCAHGMNLGGIGMVPQTDDVIGALKRVATP
jgi:heptosyltransferase-1